MKIGFIGAGRVATHLAQALYSHYSIAQVFSRQYEHAESLAKRINAQAIDDIYQLRLDLDLVIISVSDHAIQEVVVQLQNINFQGLVVHTSGSTHLNVLENRLERVGVFYPLQTFSFESNVAWKQTPLFIEAKYPKDLNILNQLAELLSQKVYQYSSEQRLSLHLAAVFACNFSNYCYDISKQILDEKQVDFSLLYPLILETAKKATEVTPLDAQTGPAMRGDQNIIHMHQDMLQQLNRQEHVDVYALLSQQILNRHHMK
jgi:predicted short-subunit dehydrogenase-like oxidoreductase (DUF2520 family)